MYPYRVQVEPQPGGSDGPSLLGPAGPAASVCAVVGAAAAGAMAARGWALSTTMLLGGVPVTLSRTGEALALVTGLVLGMSAAGVLLAWPPLLPLRRNRFVLAAVSVPVGALAGIAGLLFLGMLFFTIPQELFDVLTD